MSDLTLTISYNEMPWIYLKKLLEEEDSAKEYYRDVVKHILGNQAFVPQWLLDSYKLHKPSELLYMYLQYGRLDEAAELAIDFVRAYSGYRSETFGFKYYVAKTLPSFPVNTMDLLLHQLKSHGRKDKVCQEVNLTFNQFFIPLFKSYSILESPTAEGGNRQLFNEGQRINTGKYGDVRGDSLINVWKLRK